MVWSMCRRAWKYGLEWRVCRIGKKEQVVVNGGWLRYSDLLNSAPLFLPSAITTVMSCDESHVPVEFLYQQFSATSECDCLISFSTS
jgi:hypothetical protein